MLRSGYFLGCTLASVLVALSACSGGGKGNSSPPSPPPTVPLPGLGYTAPPAFTVGTPIATLNPTVTGNVTAFAVAPALPAGLTLSTSTGAIAGTPTAITPAATYVVTATNAGGSTNFNLSLTVNDRAPTLRYPSPNYSFTAGVESRGIAPELGGGTVTQWSVNPPLPAGLALTGQGVLAGTPTAAAARASYRVTALNTGGNATFDVSLGVAAAPLLDLGNGDIDGIVMSGSRILSHGSRTVLWDAQSGGVLAAMASGCDEDCETPAVALQGSTALMQSANGFRLYDAASGALLADVNMPTRVYSWWKLATDGSYVAYVDGTTLTVRSRTGALLFTRPGNYADANVFAEPGALRVGYGPAGTAVIETIAVPGGTVTQSPPFLGIFHAWFDDGQRFLSRVADTWYVYSKDATQQQVVALPPFNALRGAGDWYWGKTGIDLHIYRVGSGATPVATHAGGYSARIDAAAGTLAVLDVDDSALSIYDLTGSAPVRTDYASPIGVLSAYAAASPADWVVGTARGELVGEIPAVGAPQRYSGGGPTNIAASAQRVAVATPAGIRLVNAVTRVPEGVIPFDARYQLSISSDGATLAAVGKPPGSTDSNDRLVRFYALPARTLIGERTYLWVSGTNSLLAEATISSSGTRVSEVLRGVTQADELRITLLDGTPVFSEIRATGSIMPPLLLSPGENSIATSDGRPTLAAVLKLYPNGVLLDEDPIRTVAVGWLDNNRLLVNFYQPDAGNTGPAFARAEVITSTGSSVAMPPLPELTAIQPVSASTLYAPDRNEILDFMNGSLVWSSGSPIISGIDRGRGAVAGSNIAFKSAGQVLFEPY